MVLLDAKWWRDEAAIVERQHYRDDRHGAKQNREVVRMQDYHEEWSDDGAYGVARVGETETMRSLLYCRPREQGVKSEIEGPKSETDKENRHEEERPRVCSRDAGGTQAQHDE